MRQELGEYNHLSLRLNQNAARFYNYMRMKFKTSNYILEKVGSKIEAHNYHVHPIQSKGILAQTTFL